MVIQTILIYLILTIVLYFASKSAEQNNKFLPIVGAIFLYAVIFGLRTGVGVDFWGYKEWYDIAVAGFDVNSDTEVGFNLLIKTCVNLGLPFSVFLFNVAFIQLLLVYLSVKPYKPAYSMLALTFMLGCIWLTYANGLRQQIAFCIFAYSIQFIADRSIIKHYLCILIACLFHSSAILLVIFYPLFLLRAEFFHKLSIQYILLGISLMLSTMSIVSNIVVPLEQFAEVLGYGYYFDNKEIEFSEDVHIGLGFFINLLLAIFIIYNSNFVKGYYKHPFVSIIYDLLFIGIIWQYVFIDSHLFSRINYYLLGFQYIFAALSLAALRKTRPYQYYIILGLYILIFIATLYRMKDNTALFVFNWQDYQFPIVM